MIPGAYIGYVADNGHDLTRYNIRRFVSPAPGAGSPQGVFIGCFSTDSWFRAPHFAFARAWCKQTYDGNFGLFVNRILDHGSGRLAAP